MSSYGQKQLQGFLWAWVPALVAAPFLLLWILIDTIGWFLTIAICVVLIVVFFKLKKHREIEAEEGRQEQMEKHKAILKDKGLL